MTSTKRRRRSCPKPRVICFHITLALSSTGGAYSFIRQWSDVGSTIRCNSPLFEQERYNNPSESESSDNRNNYQSGNVLIAEDSMFKQRSSSTASERCTWPIVMVEPQTFSFLDGNDINLSSEMIRSPRPFEYGSSWVEHYYRPMISECKKRNRMEIIRALYQWYTAQFTLDYLHEDSDITVDQFRYASYLSHDNDDNDDESCLEGITPQINSYLKGCRGLMADYTNTMHSELPPNVYQKVKEGTDAFFRTSIDQIAAAHHRSKDDIAMPFEEYMRFRAVNAGGMFGFIEQCHLFQYFYPDHKETLPDDEFSILASNVGLHIALLNDLYGLDRDEETGDLNIILKYSVTIGCTTEEAIEWAVGRLQRCAISVYDICEKYPNTIPSKFNIAMGCISGNHGFHDVCKRYKLPKGFLWPDTCLMEYPPYDTEISLYSI